MIHTVDEAAKLLGIGHTKAYTMVKDGLLRHETTMINGRAVTMVPDEEIRRVRQMRDENVWTLREVAGLLGLSENTIKRQVRSGKITTAGTRSGPGGQVIVVSEEELARLLKI